MSEDYNNPTDTDPEFGVTTPAKVEHPVSYSDQAIRAEALRTAREIVVSRPSMFGGAKVEVETGDLCDLAEYIVRGTHPLTDFRQPLQMAPPASITVNVSTPFEGDEETRPVLGVVLPDGTGEPSPAQMDSISQFVRLVIEKGDPSMFAYYEHDEMTLALMHQDIDRHLEAVGLNNSRSDAKIAACISGWLCDRVLIPEMHRMDAEQQAGAAERDAAKAKAPSRDPLGEAVRDEPHTCPGGC